MNGITTRVHWTDQPYKWHVNDGEEVFAVLDGKVDMHYRVDGFHLILFWCSQAGIRREELSNLFFYCALVFFKM